MQEEVNRTFMAHDRDLEGRFAFGKNWAKFVGGLNKERIEKSQEALGNLIGTRNLHGIRFLDIGCGSGLSSLAARSLGADVLSFDYDEESVATTRALKEQLAPGDTKWRIDQGSALDPDYLVQLGKWDVVYSWGVLHHTGDMWAALSNVTRLVDEDGWLVVAIYNDQGHISRRWARIKKAYVDRPLLRPFLLTYGLLRIWGWTMLLDFKHLRPFATWRNYGNERGMSAWHDLVDWVGGYPFEVAKPEEIFDFYQARGFRLERLITRQGRGCNEFCFRREGASPDAVHNNALGNSK